MAKVKFSKDYQDNQLQRKVKAGEEVEMTLVRADEIVNNIRQQAQKFPRFKDYKDFSYTRVEEKDKESDKNTKEKKAKDKE